MNTTQQAKHTPGPWGIEETATTMWVGRIREDAKCGEIVSSHEIEGLKKECEAEQRANARLIASAPELLEAAKKANDLISWLRNMTMQGQIHVTEHALSKKPSDYEAMKSLDDVISKAEGMKL